MPPASELQGRATGQFPPRVGGYDLLLPIASGGMGTVFLARKRGPGGYEREVALKLTHAFLREQPEWAAELVEEAKLASRIHHPNVVQVFDVEDDPFGVFLVMQYVEGDSLHGLLRHAHRLERAIPTDVGLRILLDALAGLHAAHELRDAQGKALGLVHRDFTPQNILVGTDGISRLTDFGVAKAASRVSATRTGVVKGKTAYMSPEQIRAQPVDRRADVWAAAVVAWELFAGRRMRVAGDDAAAFLLRVATELPPRLRTVLPDVPAAVDEAIAQALSLDRAQRCPTAARFAELLERAWAPVVEPAPPSAVGQYVRAAVADVVAGRREQAARASAERSGQGTDASLVTPARAGSNVRARQRARSWLAATSVAVLVAGAAALSLARARATRVAASAPAPTAAILPSASGSSSPTTAPAPSLHIVADAPVAEVRIDGRATVLAAPATDVVLELPANVVHPGASVEAIAKDGRRATVQLGADETGVTLSFSPAVPSASAAAPVPRPRRRVTPSPAAAAPTQAASQQVPLAKSPYE